jgi:hypothetical protein
MNTQVLLFDVPPIKLRRPTDALDRKRKALWRNRPRNRLIAAIATAFYERAEIAWRWAGRAPDWRTIAVLVESVEHLCELMQLLDGFRPCDLMPHDEVYPPNDAVAERETESDDARVVTSVYAHRYGLDADIVIRATGGRGRLPWTTARVLVDFHDRVDDQAVADTLKRIEHYEAERWPIRSVQSLRTTATSASADIRAGGGEGCARPSRRS